MWVANIGAAVVSAKQFYYSNFVAHYFNK
jgi:hypothetical protein